MMYKKLYKDVLALGAAFVVTSSVSYSMSSNMCYQVQKENNYNFVKNGNFTNNCSYRFMKALGDFRGVMARSSASGGVNLADFPAVISAQTKLIEAMSDVISFLLQRQEQQFGKSGEIGNMLAQLGNMFLSDQGYLKPTNAQDLWESLGTDGKKWAKELNIDPEYMKTLGITSHKELLDHLEGLRDKNDAISDDKAGAFGNLLKKVDKLLNQM